VFPLYAYTLRKQDIGFVPVINGRGEQNIRSAMVPFEPARFYGHADAS
jgi:hypothetical protein